MPPKTPNVAKNGMVGKPPVSGGGDGQLGVRANMLTLWQTEREKRKLLEKELGDVRNEMNSRFGDLERSMHCNEQGSPSVNQVIDEEPEQQGKFEFEEAVFRATVQGATKLVKEYGKKKLGRIMKRRNKAAARKQIARCFRCQAPGHLASECLAPATVPYQCVAVEKKK
eukprot:TRINITY_DN6651_c0_g2_i1.p3 TRINITY_DN6651_c0_g2~~TRINITY_DN6651_c0_g2_i1.p3  ORF type:complete len:169 (-),score=33.18 TRINITY_DN6651_c0_g2_i1:101-607(-)